MSSCLVGRAWVPRSRYHLFRGLRAARRSAKHFLGLVELLNHPLSTLQTARPRYLILNLAARPKRYLQRLLDPSPRVPSLMLANELFGNVQKLDLLLSSETCWIDVAEYACLGWFANVKDLRVHSNYHEGEPKAELLASILSCLTRLESITLHISRLSYDPELVIALTGLRKLRLEGTFNQSAMSLLRGSRLQEFTFQVDTAWGALTRRYGLLPNLEGFRHFLLDSSTSSFSANRCRLELVGAGVLFDEFYADSRIIPLLQLLVDCGLGIREWEFQLSHLPGSLNQGTLSQVIGLSVDEVRAKLKD
ncbi:hypothetical protein VNI00_012148 [Paramarasmius palmivorus]|uniref:Uncharacterized protein n=1 Tax=Paramarasmius palmivorus TaxID=297713 RepID=A0AAW0C6A1_9AGAR